MPHDDLRPHEYEDVQELHATNRNDGGSPPDEPNVLTQCPAYGPVKNPSTPLPPHMSHDDLQPHVYEDIQELRATNHNDGGSPPDEPNVLTQCPAYGPVKNPSTPLPPHMSHDDLQPHVYEDIQELRATNHNDGGSPPDELNVLTQCPA